jgi:hypothetical protein
LTPGAEPFPLIGQRSVRGWFVLMLVALSAVAVAEAGYLVWRVSSPTIRVTPAAEHLGAGVNGAAITDLDVRSFAATFVAAAETWSYDRVGEIPDRLRSRLHPSMHADLEKQYRDLESQVKPLWQHHTAVPIESMIGSRANGIYLVGVYYQQVEQTGQIQSLSLRKTTADVSKVAVVTIVPAARSQENPHGLLVTNYDRGTKEEWLRNGLPAFWEKPKK